MKKMIDIQHWYAVGMLLAALGLAIFSPALALMNRLAACGVMARQGHPNNPGMLGPIFILGLVILTLDLACLFHRFLNDHRAR